MGEKQIAGTAYWRWCFALSAVMWLAVGCGGEKVYELSGSVTFQGKPVGAGQITFEPDPTAGNSGPAGFAKIKDGHYDTKILEGRGTIGGPHIVTIHGRDGIPRGELLNGLPMFQDYSTTVDLPKQSSTKDFEVPVAGK